MTLKVRTAGFRGLSSGLDILRKEGRNKIRAMLNAGHSPKELPSLQGVELANYHLRLALSATQEMDENKTEAYRKLRLLLNRLEQSTEPKEQTPVNSLPPEHFGSRRARLLSKTIESAQMFGSWRKKAQENPLS